MPQFLHIIILLPHHISFILIAQFTQLIWKGTNQFGIGYAEYEPTDMVGFIKTIVVAHYYPGGNIENQFPGNISKPNVDRFDNRTLITAQEKYSRQYSTLMEKKLRQYERKLEMRDNKLIKKILHNKNRPANRSKVVGKK